MGKNREYTSSRRSLEEERPKINPVWRGVGFMLIILIPVISYAATEVLLKQNGIHNWFPLPIDLLARPGQIPYLIFPDPLVNIKLMLFVAFVFVFYAIFTLFSFVANSLFGTTRDKDPFYVPPVKRSEKRRF